jgi:hypothetical protein
VITPVYTVGRKAGKRKAHILEAETLKGKTNFHHDFENWPVRKCREPFTLRAKSVLEGSEKSPYHTGDPWSCNYELRHSRSFTHRFWSVLSLQVSYVVTEIPQWDTICCR